MLSREAVFRVSAIRVSAFIVVALAFIKKIDRFNLRVSRLASQSRHSPVQVRFAYIPRLRDMSFARKYFKRMPIYVVEDHDEVGIFERCIARRSRLTFVYVSRTAFQSAPQVFQVVCGTIFNGST